MPTVVSCPLDVAPAPALKRFEADIEKVYVQVFRDRAEVLSPSKKETSIALAALSEADRKSFARSNEAIKHLADSARTLYAIFVSIEYTQQGQSKMVVVSGRVVRTDGVEVANAHVQMPKNEDKLVDVAKILFLQLFESLGLSKLPSHLEADTVKPLPSSPDAGVAVAVEAPKPDAGVDWTAPPPPVVDEGETQRTAGKIVFGTGLGVAVVGGVLGIVGIQQAGSLTPTANGSLQRAQLGTYQTASALRPAGLVVFSVGAAATALGAVLWLTAPDAPVRPVVNLQPGGATFGLAGEFP